MENSQEVVHIQMSGNPQIENGHIDIANELGEAFAKVNLSSYEWRVLWAILRKTYGWHKKSDWISLSQFIELTGLTKPHIIRAIKKLIKKNIIVAQIGNSKGKEYSINKHYKKWNSLPKQAIVAQIGNKSLPKQAPTKETIQKKINIKRILYASSKFQNITEEHIKKWSKVFPLLDIQNELLKMEIWLEANPERQKKRYERFIFNWLSRAKGGKDGRNQKYIPISRKDSDEHQDRDIPAGEW